MTRRTMLAAAAAVVAAPAVEPVAPVEFVLRDVVGIKHEYRVDPVEVVEGRFPTSIELIGYHITSSDGTTMSLAAKDWEINFQVDGTRDVILTRKT